MAESAVYLGYTRAQLDQQYDARAAIKDASAHDERWRSLSAKARALPSTKHDIAYGPGPTDKLDIYMPEGKGPHPVLVFYHGGYWRARSKDDFGFLGPWLTPAGVTVVVVDYALCPTVTMDELVAQCRRSLVWIAANIEKHGGNPNRLHISGHSAGGHITAMLASTDWAAEKLSPVPTIRAALAISGLFDLEPFPHSFLQPDLRLTPEQMARNSPIRFAHKLPTQMMLAVGGDESDEFHRQMDTYAEALGRTGNRYDVVRAGGRDHFSVLNCMEDPLHMLRQSLMRLMRP